VAINPIYKVGDAVPVLGACGHDLIVEHVIVAGSQKPAGASEAGRDARWRVAREVESVDP
jgi:hypothetical protein